MEQVYAASAANYIFTELHCTKLEAEMSVMDISEPDRRKAK